MQKQWSWPKVPPYDYFLNFLFLSPEFQKSYLDHLNRITDEEYLHSFFKSLESDIQDVNNLMATEHGNRLCDTTLFFDNAKQIRLELPKFKDWLANDLVQMQADTAKKRSTIDPLGTPILPLLSYRENDLTYTIQNFGGRTATLISYKPECGDEPMELNKKVKVGVTGWRLDEVRLKLDQPASKFYYQLEGNDKIHSTTSYAWPSPKPISPRRSLAKLSQNPSNLLHEENGYLRIKEGEYSLDKILFIPSGSKLKVDAGVRLIVDEGGGIICESPIIMQG